MKNRLSIFMLILLVAGLAFPFAATQAQTPSLGSAEDNACNPGGVLAGKCDTDWEWACGWYLARWQNAGGWSNPANRFVDWCNSLLPLRSVVEQPQETAISFICHLSGLNTFCFNVNQTGYQDTNTDGVIDGNYVLGDFGGGCPVGYPIGPFPTLALANPGTGFTADELFNILGLGPDYCVG